MKYTLEELRKMIVPMIQSMPIGGDVKRNADGSYTFTAKGDAAPVADAIVELIKQDREATIWNVEYELASMVAMTWYEREKPDEAHEVLDRELVLKVIKKAIGETDDKA